MPILSKATTLPRLARVMKSAGSRKEGMVEGSFERIERIDGERIDRKKEPPNRYRVKRCGRLKS